MLGRAIEQSPIGLDIGEAGSPWVRAVQRSVGRRARPPRMAKLSRSAGGAGGAGGTGGAELTPERIAALMDALERQGFSGRRVVLTMPQKKLLTAVLDVPPRSSGAPLDVICRNELARTHRVEPESIECGWWELPAPPASAGNAAANAGPQVIAVGCRASDADELIARFEAADVAVCGIDCRSVALARGAQPAVSAAPELTAIVEWESAAALVVVVRGETILYERHLPEAGVGAVRTEISKKLSIEADLAAYLVEELGLGQPGQELAEDAEMVSHAQRLVSEQLDSMALEIRASAAYAARRFGDSVTRLVVAGLGAEMPGVAARLHERTEIDAAASQASGESGYVTALGLSAMPAEVLA